MLKKLKSKFVSWLLRGVHIDVLHIGEHSVVVSGTGINMDAQKIENVAEPDSDDDVPRRDTIDSKIATHEEKTSDVHGVGASTVCSETEADTKVSDHAGLPNAHHNQYGELIPGGFRVNPGYGTMAAAERVNDVLVDNSAYAQLIDEYTQVDLPETCRLTQFRQYGTAGHNGTGRWKIQYLGIDDNWHDWVTNLPVEVTAGWGDWDSSGGEVTAKAIKLIGTTIDTGAMRNYIFELEAKY